MKIFITGAAGYIGGALAHRWLAAGHEIRGLVRDQAKAGSLLSRGISPVVGTLDDRRLLIEEAQAADVVVNAADSDDKGSVEALIDGLRGSGKALLHTSGSSVVGDDAEGDRLSDRIYDESTPFVVEAPKQERHEIDKMVVASADIGVRGVVLCNTMVYGTGAGLNPESIQLPMLVRAAQTKGRVRVIGRGVNRWSNVHIDDVCSRYCLVLANAPAGAFYLVENGEASFLDIGESIARRLGFDGVEHWTVDEATRELGPVRYGLASNSRVRSVRARRELGWAPVHTSVTHWIEHEMPLIPSR